jgi:hypothetical protein
VDDVATVAIRAATIKMEADATTLMMPDPSEFDVLFPDGKRGPALKPDPLSPAATRARLLAQQQRPSTEDEGLSVST